MLPSLRGIVFSAFYSLDEESAVWRLHDAICRSRPRARMLAMLGALARGDCAAPVRRFVDKDGDCAMMWRTLRFMS